MTPPNEPRERGARASQIRRVSGRVARRVAGNGHPEQVPAEYVVRTGRAFECIEHVVRDLVHGREPIGIQHDAEPLYHALRDFLRGATKNRYPGAAFAESSQTLEYIALSPDGDVLDGDANLDNLLDRWRNHDYTFAVELWQRDETYNARYVLSPRPDVAVRAQAVKQGAQQ